MQLVSHMEVSTLLLTVLADMYMVGFVVRSGYHIDGTRSAEKTHLSTKIRSERNGRVEDDLNSEPQLGTEAFPILRHRTNM